MLSLGHRLTGIRLMDLAKFAAPLRRRQQQAAHVGWRSASSDPGGLRASQARLPTLAQDGRRLYDAPRLYRRR